MARIVIGVDPHKASNTLAVIDGQEQILGRERFVNDRAGYRTMRSFGRAYPDRVWAVEGARGVGAGLAQRLVADGEQVLDVPAKLSARVRALGGGSGRKTDDADAFAVAVAGLRSPQLQRVRPLESVEVLRLLTSRRSEIVAQRIATVNRLHDVLLHLVTGGAKRHLSPTKARALLASVRPRDVVGKARKQLALDYTTELEHLDARRKDLTKQLAAVLVEHPTRLVTVTGLGVVTAAHILAEVGDIRRFASRHHFASYTGTARSTSPPATTTGTASTAAATAGSTTRSTSPPSSSTACPALARTTTDASAPPARPTWKPSAASSAGSPTSSTGPWSPTSQQARQG